VIIPALKRIEEGDLGVPAPDSSSSECFTAKEDSSDSAEPETDDRVIHERDRHG
jgi:hypothetical protein